MSCRINKEGSFEVVELVLHDAGEETGLAAGEFFAVFVFGLYGFFLMAFNAAKYPGA